jgi:hypothetical protein
MIGNPAHGLVDGIPRLKERIDLPQELAGAG